MMVALSSKIHWRPFSNEEIMHRISSPFNQKEYDYLANLPPPEVVKCEATQFKVADPATHLECVHKETCTFLGKTTEKYFVVNLISYGGGVFSGEQSPIKSEIRDGDYILRNPSGSWSMVTAQDFIDYEEIKN